MRKQRLVVDEKVEVRSTDDGFLGSWHSGTVISSQKGIRLVLYDHLLSDNNNDKLIDSVNVNNVLDGFDDPMLVVDCCFRGLIRPLSSLVDFDMWGVEYGQCVDVYYMDAWWEGVIFDRCDEGVRERSVFFPDIGDELMADVSNLRVSQDWDECSGVWKLRGKWLFLELIDEFEKEFWPIVVSVKQIWYDVRVKKGFVENVKEWTCLRRDVWRGLLVEVLADNFKLIVKELCRELEFSGVKGLEKCYQILELKGSDLYDLIKSKTFDEISRDEVLAVGESDRLNMLPLSSLAKPTHEDEARHGSSAKYDNSCNSSRDVIKKSGLRIWFLADIAPKCCDNAVEVYMNYKSSKNRETLQEVTINLRRHLLFLGWKVEYLQEEGFRRWRYTQPDGNEECFNSLVKVCRQIRKSDSTYRFPLDDQNGLPHAADSMVLTPISEKFQECKNEHVKSGLPHAADSMVLTPIAEKFQERKNEHVKNPRGMLEYEYCPQAVINYYSLEIEETIHPKDHDKIKDMQLKAKKHLSAVGWKLYPVYRNDRNSKEIRYRAPWGRLYSSLRTACKAFLDENRNVWKVADAQLASEGPCLTIAPEEFHGKHEKKEK